METNYCQFKYLKKFLVLLLSILYGYMWDQPERFIYLCILVNRLSNYISWNQRQSLLP